MTETTFKVGQRVICADAETDRAKGLVGTIHYINPDGNIYSVHLDAWHEGKTGDGHGGGGRHDCGCNNDHWNFLVKEIELVKEKKMSEWGESISEGLAEHYYKEWQARIRLNVMFGTSELTTIERKQKTMRTLTKNQKANLSEDAQALVQAGIWEDDLTLDSSSIAIVYLVRLNQKAIADLVRQDIAEEEAAKKVAPETQTD